MTEEVSDYIEIEWYDARTFEQRCAAELDLTVEQLHAVARVLTPCHCGQESCPGWKSRARTDTSEWPWPEN